MKLNLFFRDFSLCADAQENNSNGKCPGKGKTLIEVILIFFPLLIFCLLLVYPILYFLDLDIPLLLISSVPANFQNFFTTTLCLIIEMSFFGIYLTWGYYLFFAILSFVMTFVHSIQIQTDEAVGG